MRDRPRLTAALTAIAALIYGASPIDIIPELLGPIGFADDAAVLVAAAAVIYRVLRKRRASGRRTPHDPDEIVIERFD